MLLMKRQKSGFYFLPLLKSCSSPPLFFLLSLSAAGWGEKAEAALLSECAEGHAHPAASPAAAPDSQAPPGPPPPGRPGPRGLGTPLGRARPGPGRDPRPRGPGAGRGTRPRGPADAAGWPGGLLRPLPAPPAGARPRRLPRERRRRRARGRPRASPALPRPGPASSLRRGDGPPRKARRRGGRLTFILGHGAGRSAAERLRAGAGVGASRGCREAEAGGGSGRDRRRLLARRGRGCG